jgi:hypothetical protein
MSVRQEQLLPSEYRRVQTPKESDSEAAESVCPHVTNIATRERAA